MLMHLHNRRRRMAHGVRNLLMVGSIWLIAVSQVASRSFCTYLSLSVGFVECMF